MWRFFVLPTLLCSTLLFLSTAQPSAAVLYDVAIRGDDVSFSPPELIAETPTRVYATINNAGERDVEGDVRFYDNGTLIGTKAFSIRANSRPEDIWVRWIPTGYGAHTIRITVQNDLQFPDGNTANDVAELSVFVDRDTDGDGVPDRSDDDQDNDGVLNVEEAKSATNPLQRDTDGDGVDDRRDAFPLDAKRSVLPPPVPTSTKAVPVKRAPTPAPTPTKAVAKTISEVSPVIDAGMLTTSSNIVVTTVEATTTETVLTTSSWDVMDDAASIPVQGAESSDDKWRMLLIAAALVSALAAGAFIWLGGRAPRV